MEMGERACDALAVTPAGGVIVAAAGYVATGIDPQYISCD
jgi:hypothetical protein